MSTASEVRLAFGAMVDTLDRLAAVASAADALPSLEAPRLPGSVLATSLGALAGRCERARRSTADELEALHRALDLIVGSFASTDEGLAQLVAGPDRQIRSAPVDDR